MRFFSLSRKEIHITNECMRRALGGSKKQSKVISP